MANSNKRSASPATAPSASDASPRPGSSGSQLKDPASALQPVKTEESNTQSPLLDASHIKTSRSPSLASPIKPDLESPDFKPKAEHLNGSASPINSEMPKKSGRAAAAKAPPRIAPLFADLPDVTAEATSSFQVITSSTYQNKYLGLTESALECDCSEEWGE